MVREYTVEFKLEAVKLANEQRKAGQPVAKVARDHIPRAFLAKGRYF